MQVEYLIVKNKNELSKDAENKASSSSTRFICRYNFDKFFSTDNQHDTDYLSQY